MNRLGRERRDQILSFIREYAEQHGYAPSHREIMNATGLSSPNGVREHLAVLQEEGKLTIAPGVPRGIRLL